MSERKCREHVITREEIMDKAGIDVDGYIWGELLKAGFTDPRGSAIERVDDFGSDCMIFKQEIVE